MKTIVGHDALYELYAKLTGVSVDEARDMLGEERWQARTAFQDISEEIFIRLFLWKGSKTAIEVSSDESEGEDDVCLLIWNDHQDEWMTPQLGGSEDLKDFFHEHVLSPVGMDFDQ